MRWYKIALTAGQSAQREASRLQGQFEKAFMAVGGPKDAAIFSSTPLRDETAEIIELYFSPKAYKLAKLFLKEYSGQFCEKPDKRKVDLVAGFPTARKLLD